VSSGLPNSIANRGSNWVYSSYTLLRNSHKNHSYHDRTASFTSKSPDGYTLNITYGDGSSSYGVVFEDVVTYAGVTHHTQTDEAVEFASSKYPTGLNFDGYFGFGPDTGNQGKIANLGTSIERHFGLLLLMPYSQTSCSEDILHQCRSLAIKAALYVSLSHLSPDIYDLSTRESEMATQNSPWYLLHQLIMDGGLRTQSGMLRETPIQ